MTAPIFPAVQNTALSVLQDDSSSSGPFEGPEKLLELWFSASPNAVPIHSNIGTRDSIPGVLDGAHAQAKLTGLRRVAKEVWHGMLDEVKCKVLSVVEAEDVDAYLLSESSMFVWPHKLILKTCGTTTLLLGLQTLLKIAKEICGFPGVWRCFYSRKSFMFPERQLGPHKAWTHEVSLLDSLFDGGSAYTVGKMEGDHWLLYLTPPKDDVLLSTSPTSQIGIPKSPIASPALEAPALAQLNSSFEPDSTLEILMSGLSTRACEKFYTSGSGLAARYPEEPSVEGHRPGLALAEELGLDAESLIGGGETDAFLFSPCGFSANMIGGSDQQRYATIHVTPEEAYSYASFECNVDYSGRKMDLIKVVNRVLGVFEPKRMSITLFVSQESEESDEDNQVQVRENQGFKTVLGRDLVRGYKRTDRIIYEFEGYDLVFATFERL